MKVLELLIDKKIERYNLPTQWSEVSISQYAKLMKVLENDTINEIELLVRTLESLLDIDAKILVKVPLKYLKEVYIELEPLTKEMPSNELNDIRLIESKGSLNIEL